MALDTPELLALISDARVLITSGRPHALAKHGLDEQRLFAINPGLLWIVITAHGWHGDAAMRVGFGDALADPLTGLTAATLALEALASKRCGLLDVPLAPTAASFAAALR
jgi:crotonobetainyl-CoA:carnitine CoA-transferase CaiB-like acyl-CoA transferase